MIVNELHGWQVSIPEAKHLQNKLRERISLVSGVKLSEIHRVAAADVSFNRFGKYLYGAVVVLDFPSLEIQQVFLKKFVAKFPYVPGYLSFREAPVVIEIFREIEPVPDILLCDGQGIAHPRGIGLASHVGLFLEIPTIGCAKSLLVGEFSEPGMEKGSKSPLMYQERIVGTVLRTRRNVKPIFVSPGHHISIRDAAKFALQCSPRYRIPEPIRIAHQQVNDFRRVNEN